MRNWLLSLSLLLSSGLSFGQRMDAVLKVDDPPTPRRRLADTLFVWKEVLRNSLSGMREFSYIVHGDAGSRPREGQDWFEANLYPEYIIATRVNLNPNRAKHQGYFFKLVPQVTFRMFREVSSPIRTASFIPTFHMYYLSNIDNEELGRWNTVWTASVAHYSNGSADTLFANPQNPGSPPEINFRSGNFSTNFLMAGISKYKHWYRDWSDTALHRARYLAIQARAQYFGGIPRTALEHELLLTGLFGRFRTHLQVRYLTEVGRHNPNRIRLNSRYRHEIGGDITATYIWDERLERFGSSDLERRLSIRTQLLWRPAWAYDMAFIAQAYWGHDYYNVWFFDQVLSFRVGLEASIQPFLLRKDRPSRQLQDVRAYQNVRQRQR